MRGVDHDEVNTGIDQHLGALKARITRASGSTHQQPLMLVLGGERVVGGLLHVVDGDQPHAFVVVIDDDQLLDAVFVEKALGLVPVNAHPDGDEVLVGHQVSHLHAEVGGEAHIAVGDDADQPAGAVHHGNPRDPVALLELQHVAQRRIRGDGDGIHHHARFEALHLAHLGGLLGGLQVLVDDAEAPGLRHGDGEARLRHRVHGGGDDRDREFERPGEPRRRPHLGGQNGGRAGLHQHVVESEIFRDLARHVPTSQKQGDSRGD